MGQKEPKKGRRSGKLGNILLVAMFLIGLGLLTYPTISNYWNTRLHSQAISGYDDSISQMTKRDFDAEWAKVDAYNREITESGINFTPSAAELDRYGKLLDPAGTGMMGHIEINKLAVDLPIYHTVDDPVLQVGIGHIPGTSLPGGGLGTHTVLSGHRGLPSSKLFTDLDALDEGDTFLLHVLDRTLAYQVDQIRIVLPNELDELRIDRDQDYCTLVTCTPYAINTHRLLVRGHRVDYLDQGYVAADAVRIDPVLVASIISVPVFVVLFIILMVATAQRNRENKRKQAAMEKVGKRGDDAPSSQD
ncbi:MAG TPA: class C sortase [Eggerthellaceae bacterium]|nr:class C sortase [Eggerthellaceae bacterium]